MRERKDNQSGIQGLKFRFFAFISYSSLDIEWGKRIQRKLEHYRMPATLCSEHGWSRTPINPVFFAPTDIQPGGLTEELQERLKSSKHLIVICSPNSAKSEWVGKEIAFFHHLGRTKAGSQLKTSWAEALTRSNCAPAWNCSTRSHQMTFSKMS